MKGYYLYLNILSLFYICDIIENMGTIIAITNQKGGVGKTTCCVNLAAYLAAMGKRVLIIDMDPQGNATGGLGIPKDTDKSVYSVLMSNASFLDEGMIRPTCVPGMYIVASTIHLAAAETEIALLKSDREVLLADSIALIKSDFDLIFLDCPPSMGHLTINSIIAADKIIIPIQCEYYALEGMTQLINNLRLLERFLGNGRKMDVEGVFLTMYDPSGSLSRQVKDEVCGYFGDKVYKSIIPRNVKLAEAPGFGLPIMLYAPESRGAIAYRELAEEFLRRNC